MSGSRTGRVLTVCAALLASCAWYDGASAGAAVADPAAGADTSVTVFLQAPEPDALAALAAQPIGPTAADREQRLARLAALVPSAARHREVGTALAADGFTVTDESTWSVTATAPSSVVTDVFGTRPVATAHASAAQLRAAAGPLSDVPDELSGLVSGAYPTTGGPAPFHHHATGALVGSDIRNADTAAGVAPSTGQNDAGQTIATVQLSTWQSSDLTNYANAHGLTLASGQYTAETVGSGPSDSSGSVEVDLDQQSILSTAPTARQLAVFAPNTNAGFRGAFSAVYDDVTQAGGAHNPNPNITALSVSWGLCEASTGSTNINSMQPILESLVAAGVTIFASSGDDGAYDCGDGSTGVDFPASSPSVVAVGGTRLSADSSAPNTGTNWAESAWSCSGASDCTTNGGSGGGVSAGFAKPSWQSTYVTTAPYASTSNRMVPDVAAAGDPDTGFVIYHQGSNLQYGGTSLAAPLSAASLVNLLGDNGRTTGIGDIHDGLYRAYAGTSCLAATDPLKAFRDVTVGTNGSASSQATAVGFDTVTGLGGVLWSALTPYLLTGGGTTSCTPPTVPTPTTATPGSIDNTAKLELRFVGHGRHRHRVVAATWSTTATNSAVVAVQVRIVRSGTRKYAGTAASGSTQLRAKPGRYTLTVTSTDDQGHTATATRHVTVKRPKRHTVARFTSGQLFP